MVREGGPHALHAADLLRRQERPPGAKGRDGGHHPGPPALQRRAPGRRQDGRGERLRPDGDASRIRLKAGQRQVMDGPFTETKEALGGFYLIECDTRQEAVEWAKKIPLREGSFVELRPIWHM